MAMVRWFELRATIAAITSLPRYGARHRFWNHKADIPPSRLPNLTFQTSGEVRFGSRWDGGASPPVASEILIKTSRNAVRTVSFV